MHIPLPGDGSSGAGGGGGDALDEIELALRGEVVGAERVLLRRAAAHRRAHLPHVVHLLSSLSEARRRDAPSHNQLCEGVVPSHN